MALLLPHRTAPILDSTQLSSVRLATPDEANRQSPDPSPAQHSTSFLIILIHVNSSFDLHLFIWRRRRRKWIRFDSMYHPSIHPSSGGGLAKFNKLELIPFRQLLLLSEQLRSGGRGQASFIWAHTSKTFVINDIICAWFHQLVRPSQ